MSGFLPDNFFTDNGVEESVAIPIRLKINEIMQDKLDELARAHSLNAELKAMVNGSNHASKQQFMKMTELAFDQCYGIFQAELANALACLTFYAEEGNWDAKNILKGDNPGWTNAKECINDLQLVTVSEEENGQPTEPSEEPEVPESGAGDGNDNVDNSATAEG